MFSTPKRPALGFTQPPVQWVPGLFSGVKRAGIDVDHFRPVHMLRMSGAIPVLPPMSSYRGQGKFTFSLWFKDVGI
jgi:hypothetical protein